MGRLQVLSPSGGAPGSARDRVRDLRRRETWICPSSFPPTTRRDPSRGSSATSRRDVCPRVATAEVIVVDNASTDETPHPRAARGRYPWRARASAGRETAGMGPPSSRGSIWRARTGSSRSTPTGSSSLAELPSSGTGGGSATWGSACGPSGTTPPTAWRCRSSSGSRPPSSRAVGSRTRTRRFGSSDSDSLG